MWKKLKIRYGLTDYQIALLRYLLFTFLSESSKLFLILFLYRKHLALCIATLLLLCCIRRTAGGFHCNTYAGCLFVSIGYAFLCLTLLPLVSLTKPERLLLCMGCILINYALAPVSSSKRPVLSATKKKQFKWISTGILIVCSRTEKIMHRISSYRAGKEYPMNTQTETISPVKVLLEQLARVTEWNGGSLPSIVLFGECQFPNKDEYNH